MSVLQTLQERSHTTCELCKSTKGINQYTIPPSLNENVANDVLVCETCFNQINGDEAMDTNHWRCLNDSMWSEHVAVQIMAWRMLQRLRNEGWPKDLLEMMYLDDEALALARATGEHEDAANKIIHRDIKPSNIIIDTSGELKVVDFGIATIVSKNNSSSENYSRAFTPTYASPEQIKSHRISIKTDIYSLAVVAIKLITGKSPFNANRLKKLGVHDENHRCLLQPHYENARHNSRERTRQH